MYIVDSSRLPITLTVYIFFKIMLVFFQQTIICILFTVIFTYINTKCCVMKTVRFFVHILTFHIRFRKFYDSFHMMYILRISIYKYLINITYMYIVLTLCG